MLWTVFVYPIEALAYVEPAPFKRLVIMLGTFDERVRDTAGRRQDEQRADRHRRHEACPAAQERDRPIDAEGSEAPYRRKQQHEVIVPP